MKVNRYILFTLLILVSSSTLYAQQSIGKLFTSSLLRGDEMFVDLYYEQAITFYEQALKKDPANAAIILKIAQSYRLIGDYESSVQWYDQAFRSRDAEINPFHIFNYADVLVSAGRYDEAYLNFSAYLRLEPNDSRTTRKMMVLDNLHYVYRDSVTVGLEELPFNSEFDDLAAVQYENGLMFLSARPTSSFADQDFLREENLLDIFYTSFDSSLGWQPAIRLPKGINSNYYEGPLSFSNDKSKMVLSRSNTVMGKPVINSSGKTQLQLFNASKSGSTWELGTKLPFCNSEFSYAHPALNPAGDSLFFVSNIVDGYGGNDIYLSTLGENGWTEPKNLGPVINTEGEERSPFYINNRLYFSSDGHGGLGGFDIQKAFLANGEVVRVVNVGYPINSADDDYSYIINSKSLKGYFTSNRKGGVGKDDIYSLAYTARVLNGLVYQEQDGSFIEGALVNLMADGKIIDSGYTDENGQFNFHLPLQQEFEVVVSKDEHRASVPLAIPKHINEVDLDTLMISLHKDDLFAQGRVLNNETQELMPDVRIVLHNATDNKFDTLVTDARGTYSFVLEPQKSFNIWASKSGFLFTGADINTLEIDSGIIRNDLVLELEYSKKSVVNFDFDEYKLKPEAKAILNRTAAAMRRTSHELIISAFADARGTVEYNQILSDKRAKVVEDYLVLKGVASSRITARGFGETLILNRCVDGVNCEEVEHSKNRRAEIKIEGSNVK